MPKVRQTKTPRIYPSLFHGRRVCQHNTLLRFVVRRTQKCILERERHAPRVQSGEEDRRTTALVAATVHVRLALVARLILWADIV